MPLFQVPFRKTVWGYFEGLAKDKKEAFENYTDWDEVDNKSDYEVDEKEIKEV